MDGAEKLAYVLLTLLGSLFLMATAAFLFVERVQRQPWHGIVAHANRTLRPAFLRTLVLAAALQVGEIPTLIVYAVLSFFALREFVSLTPTKPSDYRALLFAFYVAVPLHYMLIGLDSYSLFVIFVPVYVCLTLPVLSVLKADTERYLERMAKLQMGLMITVFCVSHVPALLMLRIPGFIGSQPLLLVYLLIVSRVGDALELVCTRWFGRRPVLAGLAPGVTWEGLVASLVLTTLLGAGLWWMTPFEIWESAAMAYLIIAAGFLGRFVMAAIQRSLRAEKRPEERAGLLERIDSLCFSAPLFFHLVRYFFAV